MIDKDKELEMIVYDQYQFLVDCAFQKLSSKKIDKIIYNIEKKRRKVIL